jgi:ureidoacrylate peracid hydrolase
MKLNMPSLPGSLEIDSERSALIVVDMQNAFCKKEGLFASIGMLAQDKVTRVVRTDIQVLAAARAKGLKIVYLRMGYSPDMSDAGGPDSPNYWKEGSLVARREHPELKGRVLMVGSWDWQIIDELEPDPGDILINKTRYSGFAHTSLNAALSQNQIKYLFFCGLYTNICVESTLRDAYFAEYFPVLIKDACGPAGPEYTEQATCWAVNTVFGWVITSDEFIQTT